MAFPAAGFAPTRIAVLLRGRTDVRLAAGRRPGAVEVEARATAEVVPDDDFGLPEDADCGGYSGPLSYRQGKPTC